MKPCYNRVVRVSHATYRDLAKECSRCVIHDYWWPDNAQVGTYDKCPQGKVEAGKVEPTKEVT